MLTQGDSFDAALLAFGYVYARRAETVRTVRTRA